MREEKALRKADFDDQSPQTVQYLKSVDTPNPTEHWR